MAEPLGAQMASRSLGHLLQYGEPPARRAVPLALAALNVSSPDMSAMDTLSRLSHDADSEVVHNAILALGIIGAGAAADCWPWLCLIVNTFYGCCDV